MKKRTEQDKKINLKNLDSDGILPINNITGSNSSEKLTPINKDTIEPALSANQKNRVVNPASSLSKSAVALANEHLGSLDFPSS